jgi:hypothetical protein
MRVQVDEVGPGQHPNELVVSVPTRDGTEKIAVHKRSLEEGNTLEIGYPISEDKSWYLIELPVETMSGQWRIWVDHHRVLSRPSKRSA